MIWRRFALAICVLGGLIGVILLAGTSPVGALQTLFEGSLGSPGALAGTLRQTAPLLICGVAVFLALQGGLYNIGVEGQFLVGALIAAWTCLHLTGGWIAIGGSILLAALGGLIWALPCGLIRAYRGGHEVITTIMLNSVAAFITTALVAGPLRDPDQQSPTTRLVPTIDLLHTLGFVSVAISVAIALVPLLEGWLRGTIAGYELRAVGLNSVAARFAGINTRASMVNAMALSGAIAGLGGALQVLCYEGRFYAGFSSGYGFTALGVALLAGRSAYGLLPAAFAFGILNQGSTSLQIAGIPKGIVSMVLAGLIIILASFRYRRTHAAEAV